ncbi:MAG: hypothetical protein PVG45_01680 [Gammaproteobacteria bacterium]|jgi:hypothetical protein
MMRLYDNSTGCVVANIDGKKMLVDTGTAKTFYDEYQGIRIKQLSRMLGLQLDGVLGMDSLRGKVLSLTRNMIHINGTPPDLAGTPIFYVSGVPCVDIRINEVPCRAVIKTSATTTYISTGLITRDRHSAFADDFHPPYGNVRVKKFVNYFSIAGKNFFADAGELPCDMSLVAAEGIDAIIGTDLLKRFDLVMDFSINRLHLVSN